LGAFFFAAPGLRAQSGEIAIEQPQGTNLVSGATRTFGTVAVGDSPLLSFTLKNQGTDTLSGLALTLTGPDAALFTVSDTQYSPLTSTASVTFRVWFSPDSDGNKSATLHVASSDADENPFDIVLTGTGKLGPGGPDILFTGPSADKRIDVAAVLPGGKILIGGNFTSLNGSPRPFIARLEENGAVDPSFVSAAAGAVSSVSVQLDGKIVIGTASGIQRLLPDGTPDPGFQLAPFTSPFGVQPDGKIVTFSAPWGANNRTLIRLRADGSRDPGFPAPAAEFLLVDGEGRISVTGKSSGPSGPQLIPYTTYSPDGAYLSQFSILGDGSPSTIIYISNLSIHGYSGSFWTGSGHSYFSGAQITEPVSTILGQTDGWMIITASNSMLGSTPVNGIVRIKYNSVDSGFVNFSGGRPFAIQADGKVLVSSYDGGISRLVSTPATQSLTATSADRVQWTRGGSSPDVDSVSFDISTDGGTQWTSLGAGRLYQNAWELTGLNLPPAGILRARGRTVSNNYNVNNYGLVETLSAYGVTAVPQINVTRSGTPVSSGAPPFDFGPVPGGTSASVTFTVRNDGWGDLKNLAVVKTAAGTPGDFTIEGPVLTTVPHNGETTFKVLFTPSAAGSRTATLQLASNDPDEGTINLQFTGSLATAAEAWRLTHFSTAANSGDAADTADPDGDRLPNLIEFATGTAPLAHNLLPATVVKNGPNLEFTCPRSKAAIGELTYRIEWTEDLTASWSSFGGSNATILSDDGTTQVVKTTIPAGSNGKRFLRLHVTRP
jgi:hypothetical protein